MELITTALGFTIGKAVFKAWFKNDEFSATVSEGALDTAKSILAEKRARGAVHRQVERIAESASEALESYVEFEWSNLEKYQKIEAVNVVQNAVESTGISSALMASIDFDVSRLTALVRSNLVAGGLSVDARGLAETLTSQASQMISDLASSLPEFHVNTYAEVLRREAEIITKLDTVFEEIAAVRQYAAKDSSDVVSAIFEQDYRRAIARELDKIELFGMESGIKQSSRQHSLSTAYISLSVDSSATNNTDDDSLPDLMPDIRSRDSLVYTIRAEEAANHSNLIVIKGEAGSGKTTLLQALAVRCATASYKDDMISWNNLVPFFVRLRALSGQPLPKPEELPGLVAPIISGTMPTRWVHQQLTSERGLILLDGLDEVSDDRRSETRNWIASVLDTFPGNRIVVTSRPNAIPDDWLNELGFKQLELLPMSSLDVAMFVDHWHDAVAREEHDIYKKQTVLSLAPALKEKIKIDRALIELAGTPLLCAMLCAMNREQHQNLPKNRISLYKSAVKMILHSRDEERKVTVDPLPNLDLETKLGIIREIAFWMMQNGVSMADRWRVEDFVQAIMPNFTKLPDRSSATDIVESIIQRSGILRSPVDGKIDFIHNAFKEYLCAVAVNKSDYFVSLMKSIEHEAWREVAVLAVAMTDERRRADFITRIITEGDKGGHLGTTYHLLAVRCLETCNELSPELQDLIKDRLKSLSPPSSFTEARSLSSAGDLALPLLTFSRRLHARMAASCVRALRLIGSAEALRCLEGYAGDNRATVGREILASWPSFENEAFCEQILSKVYGVSGVVTIDHPDFLSGIPYLRSTPGLAVEVRTSHLPEKVINDINQLSQLRYLKISHADHVDLTQLHELKRLAQLVIISQNINLKLPDDKFKHLRHLNLTGSADNPFDLSGLPKYLHKLSIRRLQSSIINAFDSETNVRDLSISSLENDDGNSIFQDVAKVRFLRVAVVDGERQLSYLSSLPDLYSLHIENLHNVKSLVGLENANSIARIYIDRANCLDNVSELSKVPTLQSLRISNALSLYDLSPLHDLKALHNLSLGASKQADYSFVNGIPTLRHVRLRSVDKIEPIAGNIVRILYE